MEEVCRRLHLEMHLDDENNSDHVDLLTSRCVSCYVILDSANNDGSAHAETSIVLNERVRLTMFSHSTL